MIGKIQLSRATMYAAGGVAHAAVAGHCRRFPVHGRTLVERSVRGSAAGAGRVVGLVLVFAVAVLLAAGCGDGGEQAAPSVPPSTPAAQRSVDPSRDAVLAAYDRYIEVGNVAANRGEADYPELSEVATGPALAETQNAIRDHAENGRVYAGSLVVASAAVTKLDVDAPQGKPQAIIDACIDITNYVLTYVDSGEPVDVDRGLGMFMVTVDLYLIKDQWMVVTIESHRETPCA